MSNTVIARRYAKALFDLATFQSTAVKFLDQLQRLSCAGKAVPDLWRALHDDRVPIARRLAVVDQVGHLLQLDAMVVNFCKLLVEKHRVDCWAGIVSAFTQMAAKVAGLVKVEVTTAVPLLGKEITDRLSHALSHLTRKNVDVQLAVDDALIGGAIARVEDTIYDGSIATHLRRLKEKLNRTLIT